MRITTLDVLHVSSPGENLFEASFGLRVGQDEGTCVGFTRFGS